MITSKQAKKAYVMGCDIFKEDGSFVNGFMAIQENTLYKAVIPDYLKEELRIEFLGVVIQENILPQNDIIWPIFYEYLRLFEEAEEDSDIFDITTKESIQTFVKNFVKEKTCVS